MNKKIAPYLAEAIGTFILCFIGAAAICTQGWTSQPGMIGIALAHGLALAIAVSATMHISGGHINPAVTFAMLITKRIKVKEAGLYIVAQLLGATLAGYAVMHLFGTLTNPEGTLVVDFVKLGTPHFNPIIFSSGQAVLAEAIMTAILLFAVFGTAVDGRAPKIAGFGIGLAVAMDILAGGSITGAAMNPARVFGTLVAGCNHTSELWAQHWVYWVGPMLGASIMALLYDAFIAEKKRK